MERKTDGAVTVFLSCILLIMIVFSCTIIDYTRIRVVKLQSLRALNNATNSILSNYDSQVSDEYGIFMLEKDDYADKIENYVNASLIPNQNLPEMNKIYQILYPENSKKFFNLYDYKLNVTNIKPSNSIIDKNTDYTKLQILEYMKYRAPLMSIEPFLEKLQLVSKASKTTNLLKEKMKITKKVSDIDNKYRELERLIDGLDISEKGYISYEDYFVKGILADSSNSKSMCFNEINNSNVRSILQDTVIDINDNIDDIIKCMNRIDDNKYSLVNTYKHLYNANEYISDILEDEYLSETDYEKLDDWKDRRDDLRDSFEGELEDIEDYKNNIDDCISHIIDLEYYLDKNNEAIDVIEEIEDKGDKVKDSIDNLENDIKKNKDEVIESTTIAIKDELQDLKGKLAISNEKGEEYNLVNNLYAIKDELENNIEVLHDTIPYTKRLKNENKNLVNDIIYNGFDSYEEDMIDSFLGEVRSSSNLLRNQNSYTKRNHDYTSNMEDILNDIKNSLNNKYSTMNMVFNYGDMKTLSKNEIDRVDLRDEVKENTQNIEFNNKATDVSEKIDKTNLPSVISKNKDYINLISDENADFYNKSSGNYVDKSLSVFAEIGDKLKNAAYDLRDEIYINEYILGDFSTATDNLTNSMPLTLSNYSKEDHFLNNEVEYILRGSLNENTNLKHVSNTILGMRFVMNYIHIITNSTKRTLVMGIATAIAGWWTFGLGTYIVAALIMAAWSYAESCVDVRYLLKGEEIPFIKTSGDWYTSIEGISNGIIDKASDEVCDISMQLINKASTGLKNNISTLTNKLDEDVREYAEGKLSQVLNDASRTLKYSIDEVDDTIDSVINNAFNNIREKISERPKSSDYSNTIFSGLINDVIDTIYTQYEDRVSTASYSQVINIKKEIIKKFGDKIDNVKQKIINGVTGELSGVNSVIESELKKVVDKTSRRYKEITKKQINQIAYKVRNKTSNNINSALDDVLNVEGKGSKIKSLMPSFSYNDYLRLMLLIGVDDDKKLYRVLDLIQFNLQKSRNDNNLNLTNYISGYDVSAEVTVNYLFFDLPFMPNKAKRLGKKGYTFNINTLMAY
ncbi:hypothetical protein SH1V18_34170 [Vallitalea longa]|uniref:Uncharacterized protein n=1 Tax=Vallitalea longa TaxID=2936439 RepID=A0A9W5YBH3_9FIRM|nr:DUF5702 domain-containing protein [Vallitalea longa]GKX30937.1 hypothetical protein SH1V18_34170 [Vallitalea longa]